MVTHRALHVECTTPTANKVKVQIAGVGGMVHVREDIVEEVRTIWNLIIGANHHGTNHSSQRCVWSFEGWSLGMFMDVREANERGTPTA